MISKNLMRIIISLRNSYVPSKALVISKYLSEVSNIWIEDTIFCPNGSPCLVLKPYVNLFE